MLFSLLVVVVGNIFYSLNLTPLPNMISVNRVNLGQFPAFLDNIAGNYEHKNATMNMIMQL